MKKKGKIEDKENEEKKKDVEKQELEYRLKQIRYLGPKLSEKWYYSNLIPFLGLIFLGIFSVVLGVLGFIFSGPYALIPILLAILTAILGLTGAFKFGVPKTLFSTPIIEKIGPKKIILSDTEGNESDFKAVVGINRGFAKKGYVKFSELNKSGVDRFNKEFTAVLNLPRHKKAKELLQKATNLFLINLILFTEFGNELVLYAIVPFNFEEIITQRAYLWFDVAYIPDKTRWFKWPPNSNKPKEYLTAIAMFKTNPYNIGKNPFDLLRNEFIRDLFIEIGKTSSIYNRIDLLEAKAQAYDQQTKELNFIIHCLAMGRRGVEMLIKKGYLSRSDVPNFDENVYVLERTTKILFGIAIILLVFLFVWMVII